MDALIFKDEKKVFERKAASYGQLTEYAELAEAFGFAYSETRWLSKYSFEADFINEKGEKVTLTFI